MAEPVAPKFSRPLFAPDAAQGAAVRFGTDEPLRLDCGRTLGPYTTAYMTYGRLNAARTNAILVCHALTGDQFVAGTHPVTGREGWWPTMVGPGKPIDTDRYFVLCANVIGGCMGSTGPAETDPQTDKAYGFQFPLVTIADMVRAQATLIDALKIEKLLCVTGGSMGGMQVLEWLARYPERIVSAMPIATSSRHTAQNIAFHEVGRQAIMADPNWHGGRYREEGLTPGKGLAIARMIGHLTYLSEPALERKFGRALQDRESISYGFGPDFQVENYLHHQGSSFIERFDAASYIYITRAMDYFDLAAAHGGDLARAFVRAKDVRVRQFSFSSDWLFPTAENRRVVQALQSAGAKSELIEIESDRGHDAFLLDEPELFASVREFLDAVSRGM